MSPNRRTGVLMGATLVVALSVGGLVVAHGSATQAAAVVPANFTAVAITSGALRTDEQINGSVVLSNVVQVLHRIAGQASSNIGSNSGSSSGPSSSSTGAATSRSGAGATSNTTARAGTAVATNRTTPGRGSNPFGGPTTTVGSGSCAPSPGTTLAGPGPSTSVPTSNPGGHGGPGGATTTTGTMVPSGTVPDTGGSSTSTTSPTTSTVPFTHPSTTIPTTTTCVPTSQPGTSVPTSTTAGRGTGSGTGGTRTTGGTSTGAAGGASARVTQIVTSALPAGSKVHLGSLLYTVESRPVVAMAGTLPAWRSLSLGVADGPDVAQLELSLVALGYDRSNTMMVDEHFDSNTMAAVERWQAGYGLDVTGTVTLGSIVFLPTPTTVASVSVSVGAAVGDGDPIMSLAASTQQVVITVPTGDEAVIVPGLKVSIGAVAGTVTLLRSATQNGTAVVQAVITPQAAIPDADNGATVKVHVTQDHMKNALLAPAAALASRIDGTYALQVLGSDGSITWHSVEVLGVSGADVAVRGDGIANGTQVLQPL